MVIVLVAILLVFSFALGTAVAALELAAALADLPGVHAVFPVGARLAWSRHRPRLPSAVPPCRPERRGVPSGARSGRRLTPARNRRARPRAAGLIRGGAMP